MQLAVIQQKIYEVRGYKVMLDYDLAELYGTETKRLNEQVKRNLSRFPKDFMFRLTAKEWQMMRSQIATASSAPKDIRSRKVTALQEKRNVNVTPYAFTEHGVTMLASVLKSKKAVHMNIGIVRVFIALRQFALNYKDLAEKINELRKKIGGHDVQFNQIYDGKLLNDKAKQKAWEDRERIGFRK
jgi:hypothetical protein